MSKKKHAHEVAHATHEKPKNRTVPLAIAVVIILVIVGAAFYFSNRNGVVASVDGKNIYRKQIDALYNSLPNGTTTTRAQLLTQMINSKILADFVEKEGYALTDAEFQKALSQELAAAGMTQDDLNKQLALRGATLDDVRETLNIELFVKAQIDPHINVTQSDIVKYRLANQNADASDAQIKALIIDGIRSGAVQQLIDQHKKDVKVVIYDSTP